MHEEDRKLEQIKKRMQLEPFWGKKGRLQFGVYSLNSFPWAGVPSFMVGDGGDKECDSREWLFKGGKDHLLWARERRRHPKALPTPDVLGACGAEGRYCKQEPRVGGERKAILTPWDKNLCLMLRTLSLTCSMWERT